MRKEFEIKIELDDKPAICKYLAVYEKYDGAWEYDLTVLKLTCENREIPFEFIDARFEAQIENAMEDHFSLFYIKWVAPWP